jgi:hypothetical protein
MIWIYDFAAMALTRVLTTPYGAETTGPYWYPNVGAKFSYITAVVQVAPTREEEAKTANPHLEPANPPPPIPTSPPPRNLPSPLSIIFHAQHTLTPPPLQHPYGESDQDKATDEAAIAASGTAPPAAGYVGYLGPYPTVVRVREASPMTWTEVPAAAGVAKYEVAAPCPPLSKRLAGEEGILGPSARENVSG